MASSTLYSFRLGVSDVDRGVYEDLEFKVPRHPSETAAYMLARVLAYALEWREDLEFGRGLCAGEDPALVATDPGGATLLWVDVGAPSADRLDKVSRQADEVCVVTHRDTERLLAQWREATIRRAERVRVIGLPGAVVEPLEARLERRNDWTLLRTEGRLYVTIGDETFEGPLALHTLA